MVAVLDQTAIALCHVVTITGTQPEAFTINWCTAGHQQSGYGPRVIQLGDLVCDDGGVTTLSFTVRALGPHYWTLDGATVNSGRLSTLLQAAQLKHATCTVKLRATGLASGTVEDTTLLVGRIVAIEPAPDGAIFHVEQRAQVETEEMPRNVIKREGVWAFPDQIPEESLKQVPPVFVGKFLPHSPYSYAANDYEKRDPSGRMYMTGLRPVVVPAIETRRTEPRQQFSYQEKLSGGLSIPLSVTTQPLGFVYMDAVDGYAHVQKVGNNVHFDTVLVSDPSYFAQTARDPWVVVPLVPKTVGFTDDCLNEERLIDKNAATYASLGPNGDVYLDIPQVGDLGYISLNSTDAGGGAHDVSGAHAPCGLSVRVAIVAPLGAVSGTGNLQVSVAFPLTSDALFGVTAVAAVPSLGTAMQFLTLFLPFTLDGTFSAPGDGWGGTKFHRWDFTNSVSDTDTGDPDRTLYRADNATVQAPFRIRLRRISGTGQVHVASVALAVGCRPNQPSFQATIRRGRVEGEVDFGGRRRSRKDFILDRAEAPSGNALVGYTQKGFIKWPVLAENRLEERPALSGFYVSTLGYQDTAGGTYSGTANKILNNALHAARYFLSQYGGESSFEASGLGSWAQARTTLNAWAALGGAAEWDADQWILSAQSVDAVIRMLEQQIPGGRILRGPDGAWRAHVWTFDSTQWGNSLLSATALDARRLVCIGDAGPDISMPEPDASGVVNEIEIEYDYDPGAGRYRKLAMASADSWDDGYGGDVPDTPTTNVDPASICAWSQAIFGRRHVSIPAGGIRNPALAGVLLASILWRNYRPLPTLVCRLNHLASALQVGHVFRFSNASMNALGFYPSTPGMASSWDSVYLRVVKADWAIGERGERTRNIVAEWNPTVIADEVPLLRAPVEDTGLSLPMGQQGENG